MTARPITRKTTTGAAAAIMAAIVIAGPFVALREGKRNAPYRDSVGVLTVCYGETRVAMRRYTDVECKALLASALDNGYAPGVLECAPGVADKPRAFAASISLAYNIGTAAFCRSSIAREFNHGAWSAGCDAFLKYSYAGGRQLPGLVNRRRAERALCMEDV